MTWSDSLQVSSPSTISCVWVSHISLSVVLLFYSGMGGRVLLSDSSPLICNHFLFLIRKRMCCLFCSLCQHLFVLQSPSKFFVLALNRWLLCPPPSHPTSDSLSLLLALQDFSLLHCLDYSSNPEKCSFCVAMPVLGHWGSQNTGANSVFDLS